MLQEISKVIEWANADIKSLQFEAKKTPKQKEVELLGKACMRNDCGDLEMLN